MARIIEEYEICYWCKSTIYPGNDYISADIDGHKQAFCDMDCLSEYLLDKVDYEESRIYSEEDLEAIYYDEECDTIRDLLLMEEEE